jgi:regulator of replication initiation timing
MILLSLNATLLSLNIRLGAATDLRGILNMSDTGDKPTDEDVNESSTAFIQTLEQSGFFDQIRSLEDNLQNIAGDLGAIGKAATQRIEETESLAAHIIAIEAVLKVMLRTHEVDVEKVHEEVTKMTVGSSGSPEGSQTVHQLVGEIFTKN